MHIFMEGFNILFLMWPATLFSSEYVMGIRNVHLNDELRLHIENYENVH